MFRLVSTLLFLVLFVPMVVIVAAVGSVMAYGLLAVGLLALGASWVRGKVAA